MKRSTFALILPIWPTGEEEGGRSDGGEGCLIVEGTVMRLVHMSPFKLCDDVCCYEILDTRLNYIRGTLEPASLNLPLPPQIRGLVFR